MSRRVPVIGFDMPAADAAYQAHTALIEIETKRPDLRGNPYFQALRDTAYARFRAAFHAPE
jgi:hypothetical protein